MKPDWPDRDEEPGDWKIKLEFAGLLLLSFASLAVAIFVVVRRFL